MENKELLATVSCVAEKFNIHNVSDVETCNIGHINGTFFAQSDNGKSLFIE